MNRLCSLWARVAVRLRLTRSLSDPGVSMEDVCFARAFDVKQRNLLLAKLPSRKARLNPAVEGCLQQSATRRDLGNVWQRRADAPEELPASGWPSMFGSNNMSTTSVWSFLCRLMVFGGQQLTLKVPLRGPTSLWVTSTWPDVPGAVHLHE